MVASFDPEPARRDSASHTDMAGYANKTDARQTESRGVALPLFISLRGREEGYIPSLTRILRPNKDPHAEICMGTTTRTFYARTFTPGGSGAPRLMKIGSEPRNSRAPSRGKARKPRRSFEEKMFLSYLGFTCGAKGGPPGSDAASS